MAAYIDGDAISNDQRVELYEGGVVWIIDNEGDDHREIKLEAKAATLLFDFLLLHQNRLIRHRDQMNKPSESKPGPESVSEE